MIGRGIAYSDRDDGSRNSMNENLSPVHGESTLGLRSWGYGNLGKDSNQFLTAEGAAEAYWARFIQPLQC
jgi:hypothetical protein